MRQLFLWCSLLALLEAGCVTKSKANAQAQAAYLAGQRDGMMMAAKGTSVFVTGNVQNQIIPWTPEMTLSKAIVAAEYRGAKDPGEIIVQRKDQQPLHIRAQQLLRGEDMPLQAGDQIEIRP
jgi:hypothetical protein